MNIAEATSFETYAPLTEAQQRETDIQAVQRGLDFENMIQLRENQQTAYEAAIVEAAAKKTLDGTDYSKEDIVKFEVNKSTTHYLEDIINTGVSPKAFDRIHVVVEVAVQMNDETFYTQTEDSKGNSIPSGIEQIKAAQDEMLAEYNETGEVSIEDPESNPDDLDTTEPIETPELDEASELAEERQLLAEFRDIFSTESARTLGRLGGKGRVYKQAQAAYVEQSLTVQKLELEETQRHAETELTELQRDLAIATYFVTEQNKLAAETLEKTNNKKVTKFVNWMNRGNVATRIAKGAGLGLAAGAIGVGVGAAAGVVGAATIGVGVATAATAAARFARGYARSHGHKGEIMQQVDTDERNHIIDGETLDGETKEQAMSRRAAEVNDLKVEQAQKKNRRAVAAGVGGIALGATAAYGLHVASETGVTDKVVDWVTNRLAHNGIDLTPEVGATPTPEVTDTPDTGTDAGVEGDTGAGTGEPLGPPTPEAAAPVAPEYTSDPNFSVNDGEGGIAFFERQGLSEAQWYEVQNDLVQHFPNDFYQNYDGVRISKPGDLSLEAQQYIKNRFGL